MQEDFSERPRKKTRRPAARPAALEQALLWLDRRWYSELELERKLAQCEYTPTEISGALHECRRYGLIDDTRLAENFARDCAARGQGVRRIRQALARHGLVGAAAARALETVAPDAPEAARRALAVKLKSWSREQDWRKKREKAFRFLVGRGFPLAVIREVMNAECSLSPPARPAFGAAGGASGGGEEDIGDDEPETSG